MKKNVSFNDFCQAFIDCGRGDQFTNEALRLIFDWIESYEDDCGTETVLDVIAICCEWSEETSTDVAANYDLSLFSEPVTDEEVAEWLQEVSTYAGITHAGNHVFIAY